MSSQGREYNPQALVVEAHALGSFFELVTTGLVCGFDIIQFLLDLLDRRWRQACQWRGIELQHPYVGVRVVARGARSAPEPGNEQACHDNRGHDDCRAIAQEKLGHLVGLRSP
ncbi:hypothetical protein [Bordetella parapertussis]|uniref:hypothetical protein n=1 Tax=Bordetella parapertussis TaxID=519 RepID=UPI0013E8A4D1|nr:hypothetical protein [Bordetella parapertussis]